MCGRQKSKEELVFDQTKIIISGWVNFECNCPELNDSEIAEDNIIFNNIS